MKILELILPCSKLKEQKEFYTKILGFQLINESGNSFTLQAGKSKLTFKNDKKSEVSYYHFAFNIPENQINNAIRWLSGRAEPLVNEGSPIINFKNWNAHSVYFYDPGGNIVEFIARHNLTNSSGNEFSSDSILNISEVGMPVESVTDFYNELNSALGLDLWWGNLETFAAIGDEEGLLIVVTDIRNWFPTDKPSRIYPLSVKIEGKENKPVSLANNDYKLFTVKQNNIPEELQSVKSFLDANLKIKIIPVKEVQRKIIFDYLAEKFDERLSYNEKEINGIINEWHLFNDHTYLRRELVDRGYLKRTPDGKTYLKK